MLWGKLAMHTWLNVMDHGLAHCVLNCYYISTETTAESSEPQLSCHMKEYQELLKTKYKSLELISPLEILDCFSTQ